jgi:hypothetical protein
MASFNKTLQCFMIFFLQKFQVNSIISQCKSYLSDWFNAHYEKIHYQFISNYENMDVGMSTVKCLAGLHRGTVWFVFEFEEIISLTLPPRVLVETMTVLVPDHNLDLVSSCHNC